ncbi:MAG: hypothetical protein MUC65_10400, partial [Pontiellaceae bacterium]|nr:hypothetical protein [Pontiellaceae bacterium]
SAVTSLTLNLLRDDGAVVYLNGTEVLRDNMPSGTISYLTLASSTVGNEDESTFFSFPVSSSAMVNGTNLLAVEIHQRSTNSTDLAMDLQLIGMEEESVTDGDTDGMPDAWETAQFGSTENGLPDFDSDGDGQNNLEEFVAGTQPANAASYFTIDRINAPGIEWTALTGRVYSVDWTSNLLSVPFVEVASGLTQSNFTDNVHTGNAANYYRIKVKMDN